MPAQRGSSYCRSWKRNLSLPFIHSHGPGFIRPIEPISETVNSVLQVIQCDQTCVVATSIICAT